MSIKNRLRIFLFNVFGSKNMDFLRYLKFKQNFGRYVNYNKETFSKKFPYSYEREMQVIPKILKNPETIIDIGANYGTYSFFLSKLYPQAKIIAFEPSTSSYRILMKIKRAFGLSNVFPIKKGLGEKEEEKEIVMPMHYTIIAYVAEKGSKKGKGDNSESIQITTLDSFVKRNKITNIDFIKCDVEGFELFVFKGARKTLRKHKPLVFVEIEERHTKKYKINPQEVLKFLKKIGYRAYSIKGDGIEKAEKIVPEVPLYLFSPKKLVSNSHFYVSLWFESASIHIPEKYINLLKNDRIKPKYNPLISFIFIATFIP